MILVTGATGLTGGELMRRLSARGVGVRALVHQVAKAGALSALPNVDVAEGDMARPETLGAALHGVDRALILPMEDARIASIDLGDIAEVAATVLTGSGHEGKIYPITGPEALSMAEVAEKLSIATHKPIQYVNVAPDEARRANLANGMPPYMADALLELFAERRKGKEAQVSPVIPTVFGWQPSRFDEFAARNAAIFRGDQPAPKV